MNILFIVVIVSGITFLLLPCADAVLNSQLGFFYFEFKIRLDHSFQTFLYVNSQIYILILSQES